MTGEHNGSTGTDHLVSCRDGCPIRSNGGDAIGFARHGHGVCLVVVALGQGHDEIRRSTNGATMAALTSHQYEVPFDLEPGLHQDHLQIGRCPVGELQAWLQPPSSIHLNEPLDLGERGLGVIVRDGVVAHRVIVPWGEGRQEGSDPLGL